MIRTTPYYWDCECDSIYIHPKTTKECPICGKNEELDGMPDSRIEEVLSAHTNPMFADRESIGEAINYAFKIIENSNDKLAVTTGLYVVINTIIKIATEES